MSLSFNKQEENGKFSTFKAGTVNSSVLISNFTAQKRIDPKIELHEGRYDLEMVTCFDIMARDEAFASANTKASKLTEYRVCDYLNNIGVRVVDFKTYVEDCCRWGTENPIISLHQQDSSNSSNLSPDRAASLKSAQLPKNHKRKGLNLAVETQRPTEEPSPAKQSPPLKTNSPRLEPQAGPLVPFKRISQNSKLSNTTRPAALQIVNEKASHGESSREQTPESVVLKKPLSDLK